MVRKHRNSLDKITTPRLLFLELASDKNVVVDPKKNEVNGVLDFSTAIWGTKERGASGSSAGSEPAISSTEEDILGDPVSRGDSFVLSSIGVDGVGDMVS